MRSASVFLNYLFAFFLIVTGHHSPHATTATSAASATLPTDVPFYDTSKVGLSFEKDQQSVSGMWEVPGKPEHFLVLGYFGFVWSMYPDTTKIYGANQMKDYTKKEIANFNNMVLKGFEQGALGAAFDPNFASNHYFYILYNRYGSASSYHTGTKTNGADGYN